MNHSWKLSKNKAFEMQVDKDIEATVCSLRFDWSIRQDHAGITFWIQIYKFLFHVCFYDVRHWNYETGAWETYAESKNLSMKKEDK